MVAFLFIISEIIYIEMLLHQVACGWQVRGQPQYQLSRC